MPQTYDNFPLEISREDGAYVARVADRDLGEAHHRFPSPFEDEDLKALVAGLGITYRDIRTAQVEGRALQGVGQLFFSSVFGSRVGSFWDTRLREARRHGNGLRLQLRLRSPDLWSWPWEYLDDPDEDFLALLPDVSVVRYPEISQPIRRLEVRPPLRILVAAAHPKDCGHLDVEQEWEAMKSIALPGRVELDMLHNATLPQLRQVLHRPFHVFHFIGHGELNFKNREGLLLFEKPGGERDPVSSHRLTRVLKRQSALRLVVLNSCESGRTDRDDPFAGVAQRLIHGQIPAVVAMQFKVADAAAIVFSRRFYTALAEGRTVDSALSEARLELDAEPFEAEWGNPALYMRSSDGRLFDVASPAPLGSQTRIDRARSTKSRWWLWAALSVSAILGLALWCWPTPDLPQVQSDPGCPSPPGLNMPFARISEGEFTMGKARGSKEERPEHYVTITNAFCLGRFEVTQRQWKTVMGDNPSRRQGDDRPVEGVSWDDVQLFLGRLNRIDPSGRYGLPTEAEWELAAVSGGGSPNPGELRRFGNCLGWLDFYSKTAPVGRFRPNDRGIFDMYGNVAEWVSDWYGPYSSGLATDPMGPTIGTEKVRRGGYFGNSAENCSASHRSSAEPSRRAEDTGFRVVSDPVR